MGAEAVAGQRAHARDPGCDPGRRQRLPEPAVPHHRRRRDRDRGPAAAREHGDEHARLEGIGRLRDRRHPLVCCGLHRHERRGTRQRARRRGCARRHLAGVRCRVQGRHRHRHPRRRPRPARRGRLLRDPARGRRRRAGRGAGTRRPQLRRLADLGLRPSRRRHLHEGRRRRRRPGRQARGRNPRGRPAQPGRDRRQRR